MMLLRFALATLLFSLLAWGGLVAPARAQSAPATDEQPEESAEETKERVTAERFLQLLKSRPRLGTALDKVYGYHVGRGTLNEFCEQLATDAEKSGDGKLWMILGMVQMQRGEDGAAAESLKQAQELLPEEPLASYYLGKTLVLMGDVEGAAAAMRAAIERKPPRADMLAILQDLGRIFQRTGQSDEALAVWKELEESFPGDAQVKEEIARILAEEGVLEGAIERYTALAKSEKDRFRQVEMSIRAAQLKAQLGQTEVALADFEWALAKVNPDSWLHRDIRRRIEEVFWSSGDIDGLVGYYTDWVEKHPDDVDAMMRTARFLAVQHRLPEAEEWFRKAIERAPSKTDARMALVESLVAEGHYAKAAKEMEEIAKIEPDNPDTIVRWGELVLSDTERTDSERKQRAVEIWKKLLAKGADNAVMVARVADLMRGADATDEAIAQYQRAIELAPGEPQYREYLGEYLHQLGRKDEAVAVWQELASGDRLTRDNLVRLSEVFSTFGYGEKALEMMAQACEMKPTFGHRARYAELLRQAERYEESLAQLDLAEPLADDAELAELVMQERIKNYQASGELTQRVDEAQAEVEGPKQKDAAAWRRLALLLEADRKFQPACEAAQKATELEPGNAELWETAATLQERSGQFGDAIESYRKLATIDRRYLSNYLTQIASLEMRLGNAEGALKTGEQLIASAPGNTEHYRFFAELCFQVGEEERGLDVLRRSMRSNPSDSDALLYLARVLGEAFRTDEAIELYWRAFDLATDLEGKTTIVAPLTELYLRTNRFETLTERLEATGREQNKPREGLLWVAAAHQAAGDLGTAKLMLEQLVREESRDTKLLEQLVALSRAEYDFESAAEYQKRLVAIAPSTEAEYALANILLEQGEIDQSEALWLKLAQRKSDSNSVLQAVGSLMAKEQYDTAAAIVDKGVASEPDNWELLAQAMMVYHKAERNADALRIAERVMAMSVDPGEPTAQVKKQMERRASQRNAQSQGNPYQQMQSWSRLVSIGGQLRAAIGPGDPDMYYGMQRGFTPSCFADVQAIALCMPLVAGAEDFDEEAFVKQQIDDALATSTPEKLWRALFYASWQNPRMQYDDTVGGEVEACLERLVELEDPAAAAMMISRFVNSRHRVTSNDGETSEPLSESELAQIEKWSQITQRGREDTGYGYFQIWVAGELARAGRVAEAEKNIDKYIASMKDKPQGGMAALQGLSVLLTTGQDGEIDPQLIAKCRTLFKSALESAKATTSSGGGYGSVYGNVITQLTKQDRWDDALECVGEVLEWQAQQTAELRPSQRERLDANTAPLNYYVAVNGNHRQVTIAFPPPSSYFGAESICILFELHRTSQEDKARLASVKKQLDQWAAEPTDDPYLRLSRLIAKASFEHWDGDLQQSEATLATAADLQVGGQFVNLARARLLNERGAMREALAVIEGLKPTNQVMLVERELAILQLVLQLGDLDRARQSAQKLFAMRLPSETEFKLADLMYQLGMTELGDRMMSRISRRAGGKQDTLVELMTRYATAGKTQEAAEIARQLIRRTEPRGSSRSYNSNNMQHEQAVRILAQAGELDKLIEQYEGLVERSPKSLKLTNQLASFYEAAGRRDDALKLQMKAVDALPADPRNLLAAGKQLARAGKHKEASEKYIAALVKNPELLNNEYYEMETSFTQAKMWGKLADAITETGLQKFDQSYRMGEILRELVSQKEHDAINRLLKAGLKDMPLQQMGDLFYSVTRGDFKLDPEVGELLVEKLESKDFISASSNNLNYVYSRSSGGQTTGFLNGMAHILHQDPKIEERAIEILSKRLEGEKAHLVDRMLLAMVYSQRKDIEGVRRAVEPLISKKKKNAQEVEAIWSIASELTHGTNSPELACELLESVEPAALADDQGSGFQYSAMALLAEAYQKAKRNSDARRILVEHMISMEVDTEQDQHNPGYGDYQYISSQAALARSFLAMGYPAEAFIAFRKAYSDESRLERASRWGSSSTRQRDSLAQEIAKATTPEFILEIVRATLGGEGEAPKPEVVEMATWLTSPEVKQLSLVDIRVTMPLEEFTLKFAEDKKLKQALVDWLAQNPLDPEQEQSLKPLVTRLLLCTAVEDTAGTELTSKAIVAWAERHEAASGDDTATEEADVADEQEESGDNKDAAKEPAPLPEELLLGMAATRIPASAADDATLGGLFERVIAIAQEVDQPELVRGLKCELARRISEKDPERAKVLLMEVLDEVLPDQQQSEATTAP